MLHIGASLTKEEVQKLKGALKECYIKTFEEIHSSPTSRAKLKETSLHLLGDGKQSSQDITYEQLSEIIVNENEHTRIALIGETGVGKTTLLAKIAHDWAKGRCFKTVDLLLLIHLRESKKCSCIGDVVMQQSPLTLNGRRINDYLETKELKTILLFDGLEEYNGNISKHDPGDATMSALRGEVLPKTTVLITTQPRRSAQITDNAPLNRIYTTIRIER